MKRQMKKLVTWMTAAALVIGAAGTSYAMPSDVGGTWNGEPQYADQPGNTYWDGATAHWGQTYNAVKYEIQLMRGGKLASTDTTTNTHISYRTLMQQSGEYTFRVRAYSVDGIASAWSQTSGNHHVSGYDPQKHQAATNNPSDGPGANPYAPGSVSYGWVRSSDGFFWRWKDANGSYAANIFRFIDGNYYYFDSNGYMFTGWLSLNGNVYYLQGNGVLQVGDSYIDGNYYYFDPTPGPGYGAQVR